MKIKTKSNAPKKIYIQYPRRRHPCYYYTRDHLPPPKAAGKPVLYLKDSVEYIRKDLVIAMLEKLVKL